MTVHKRKILAANPKTDAELWQAITDKDYYEQARLRRLYSRRLADNDPIMHKEREAARLFLAFYRWQKKLNLPKVIEIGRMSHKPNPNTKTWQEVWADMTDLDYETCLQGYFKSHRAKSVAKKEYMRDRNIIELMRINCRRLGITYPNYKRKPSADHPWRREFKNDKA